MFRSSYRIAKVMGIPIELHISLALPLIVITAWCFHIGRPLFSLVPLLLFASIVLHELGHSYVAIKKGCRVHKITLMIIGGAARIDRLPSTPGGEIVLAMAGPMVSIFLAAVGYTAKILLLRYGYTHAADIAQWLAQANQWLGLFNLIPAFPMDGGRILRALMTARMGRLRATQIAARIGKLLAAGTFIISLNHILNVYRTPGHTTEQFVTPLSLIFFSIFIYRAASHEYQEVRRQEIKKNGPSSFWDVMSMMMNQGREAEPEEEPDDEDKVVISPPPYEKKGKNSKTDIHSSRST